MTKTEQIRSEISRNLHDEVGSTLTNISLGSLLAQKQLTDPNALNRIFKRIMIASRYRSRCVRSYGVSILKLIRWVIFPRMFHYASELLEAEDIILKAEITPEIEVLNCICNSAGIYI